MAEKDEHPVAVSLPDFFDLAPSVHPDASFECSSSSLEGGGSLSVTAAAVYIGERRGVTRIPADHIDSWISAAAGPVFALTVESEGAHITHLASSFRGAAVSAMTRAYGPEGTLLRHAG